MSGPSYVTDIVLGERYVDHQTGIEGTATNGEIKDYGFDAPRLTHVESGERATTSRTGGPERGVSHVRPGASVRPVVQ